MEKRKYTGGKVYKPQGQQYWALVLVILFIGLHLVIMSSASWEDPELAWVFSCLFLPFYAIILFTLYVQIAQTSVTLYEDGLEYKQGKTQLFIEWDDMSYLGRKSHGKSSSYGIFLKRSIKPDSQGVIDRLFFGWSSDYISLSPIVKVPSRWDGCWTGSVVDLEKFAKTDFGYDLKQYAPHLFGKGKK